MQTGLLSLGNIRLESGENLNAVEIKYHVFGSFNVLKNNTVLICHGLSASSHAADWWPNMIGDGLAFDTSKYAVICFNTLGSVYGSTGARSINPDTDRPYGVHFPFFTVRDCARIFAMALQKLGVHSLHALVGASFGGYQALEMALSSPISMTRMILIASSAEESTWGRAIHSAQRLAIEADQSFFTEGEGAGARGLEAARAIGMLSYRGPEGLHRAQKEDSTATISGFKVESYLRYQGHKLAKRFHAHAYHSLSRCMDSHNIARGRAASTQEVLYRLNMELITVGINSDILNPPKNQKFMANSVKNGHYFEIDSAFGHDGFLIEHEQMGNIVKHFLS